MNGASNLAFKRGPRARACDTCRRWKKRCDQSKPACTRCTDSGTECTYSYVQVYYQYEAQTASLRQEASRRHGFIVNLAPCHGIQLAPPLIAQLVIQICGYPLLARSFYRQALLLVRILPSAWMCRPKATFTPAPPQLAFRPFHPSRVQPLDSVQLVVPPLSSFHPSPPKTRLTIHPPSHPMPITTISSKINLFLWATFRQKLMNKPSVQYKNHCKQLLHVRTLCHQSNKVEPN
ncbi:hypothetical protein DSO57_1025570 [Entomophthora muscae]|uniref:Uncharacterized protein n=1 Tax=Entomophthora muscae TaxID=34485 RepID=A0ACC2TPP0_9FUNG|nr:hypothetical protein DSO57_1025570 [Entomophthora muscae]